MNPVRSFEKFSKSTTVYSLIKNMLASNGVKKPTILVVIPFGFNDRLTMFPEFILSRLLARNGWRVIGITRREKNEPGASESSGVHIFRYRSLLSGAWRTISLILKEHPSIVHVHMLRNNRVGIVAAMLAKLLHIPLAFSEAGLLHDHYLVDDRDDPLGKPIVYGNVPRRFSLSAWRSYFFHWPLMHADAAVFYSKHNVPIAEHLGIKNVRYIPLITDGERWQSVESGGSITERLPDEPYGLFVGQMKLRKGWDILLRALPRIAPETLSKVVFVSSSATSEPEEFTYLVNSLGIRDRVVFLGRVASNTDLRVVFERSSLVVVPSLYEGFGLVALEAFEMGKPVVASGVEALTDFLMHNENAYLVPPKDPAALADAITHVSTDRKLRDHLVEGGRATLERMRGEELKTQWLHFYTTLSNRNETSDFTK